MITLIKLCGSIALLLWGIRMVRTAVTRGFGADLRRVIAATAGRRIPAFGAGIGITTLLQSSTATSLLVASFSSRAGMTAPLALAILLGADVGTTLVVQLFSHRVEWLGPLLIFAGFVRFQTTDRARPRNVGRAAIGIGLIMLALQAIGAAAAEVTGADALRIVLSQLGSEPVLAILVIAMATVLLHSSVAIVLLIAAIAQAGTITMPSAIAMVLGANLGGALLPVFASFPMGRAARIAPIANAAIRFVGVVAIAAFIGAASGLLQHTGLGPAAQTALFHTAFNLAIALIALPFTATVASLAERFLLASEVDAAPQALSNLEEQGLETPAVALACATREALRIGDIVKSMLGGSINALRTDDAVMRKQVENQDDEVDRLYEAIKLYLARLTRSELDPEESERNIEILSFTTNLEHVGDIIDKNLMELAAKKAKLKATFSPAGMAEIEELHNDTLANLDLALNVFISGDIKLARRLLAQKTVIRDKERHSAEQHFARISHGRPESIDSSSLHIDILRDLKRINGHLCAVAYPILERANELAASRLIHPRNDPIDAGSSQPISPDTEMPATRGANPSGHRDRVVGRSVGRISEW